MAQTAILITLYAENIKVNQYQALRNRADDTIYTIPEWYGFIVSWMYGSGKWGYFLRINGRIILSEDESRSARMFKGLVLHQWDTLEVTYSNSTDNESVFLCWELFLLWS